MKKIVKIIEKSSQLKKRLLDKLKGKNKKEDRLRKNRELHREEELDNRNDSKNWSYS
jgi:hypothetical protein